LPVLPAADRARATVETTGPPAGSALDVGVRVTGTGTITAGARRGVNPGSSGVRSRSSSAAPSPPERASLAHVGPDKKWWRWEELNLRHGAYETPDWACSDRDFADWRYDFHYGVARVERGFFGRNPRSSLRAAFSIVGSSEWA
jgi:hypothetical protein